MRRVWRTLWLLLIVLLCVSEASAHGKRQIDLDEEEDEADEEEDEGPVTAGQMTEEAASAKRLFDSERWSEAALLLKQVVDGETGDDDGNKQIAQYHLAIALYRLQFYQASYDIFRTVADKPNHLKFKETLLWLAKLATQLPEPADIIGSVGKYSEDQIKRFNNDQQKELYWQLNYMLGRYKYRTGQGQVRLAKELTSRSEPAEEQLAAAQIQFQAAIALLKAVDPQSPYYVKAQFFMGISYVQLRKSVPAVTAFRTIVDAIDDGIEGVEDEGRMRDLAHLSMARTFYSASIRLDDGNTPRIDEQRLSAAVKYWNLVDVGSEYWLDALFEQSWAYFMAGDYPHALGNIHTIQSPYFPNAFYPEADIVRAVIYFTTCQYDDATTLVAKFQKRYEPIAKELEGVLKRFSGEGSETKFYEFLLSVQDGTASLSVAVAPIVENALSDRQLLRNIEYVNVLNDEMERFQSAPKSFQGSPVGADVEDNISNATVDAQRRAGKLARSRYKRNLDDLNKHINDSQRIIVDITNAQRKSLDETIIKGDFTQEDAYEFGRVVPDEEHVNWPFDGEYWRDELGYYRQVVTSACGSGK